MATFDQVSDDGGLRFCGLLNDSAVAPAPEPTSVALLGTAALARRRRAG